VQADLNLFCLQGRTAPFYTCRDPLQHLDLQLFLFNSQLSRQVIVCSHWVFGGKEYLTYFVKPNTRKKEIDVSYLNILPYPATSPNEPLFPQCSCIV
jgi:hypothetical protein